MNDLIGKGIRLVRREGMAGAARRVRAAWTHDQRVLHARCTAWARFSPARNFEKPLDPPLLVMSLPRSGSSWIGSILGSAPDALYLREPINQWCLQHSLSALTEPEEAAKDAGYGQVVDRAFSGWPLFPLGIAKFPHQWRRKRRTRSRVVVKDINPAALSYYANRHRLRVVFLIRHPAAIALSFRQMGWLEGDDPWEAFGERQGALLQRALRELEEIPESQQVLYEDVALDPASACRALYEFAGLTWSDDVQKVIDETTTFGAQSDPYGIHRDTRSVMHRWRKELSQAEVDAVRAGFNRYELGLYLDDAEWGVEGGGKVTRP